MNEEFLIPFALLVMRLWLGFTILVQSYDRIFNIGIHEVSRVIEFKVSKMRLSNNSSIFLAAITSWVELCTGLFLIAGFMKIAAYLLLSVNMLLVGAAFSLNTPMWDMRHFFPRFLILMLLMLMSLNNDWMSLDWLIFKK